MMLRAKNIWVVGGDPRQAALAALLADDGHSVHTYALERGEGTRCEPSAYTNMTLRTKNVG